MRRKFDIIIWLVNESKPFHLNLFCTLRQAKNAFYGLALCSLRSNLIRCELLMMTDDKYKWTSLEYFERNGDYVQ